MRSLAFAFAAVLAGCATSSGVVPMANGTYTVTAEDNFGPNKTQEARKRALEEATKTCTAQGKDVAVTNLDNSGDIGRAAGPLALRGRRRWSFAASRGSRDAASNRRLTRHGATG